ncbi:MAG: 4Fe-4S binding protein, partial [Dethiobacter sp.]|nr:4Fe-4S binding protein [Dethiobacter sp.]
MIKDKATPGDHIDRSGEAPAQHATLWTNAAQCRDCNRCVRVCPVKAIRKEGGQARICP